MLPLEISPGVFILEVEGQKRLATRSDDVVPVYGERILEGYRLWDPFRSKLAALLLKGRSTRPVLPRDASVLYLGAATGTTVSHVSDIVRDGLVYAVEFSPRSMRDLVRLCERRKNIVPILADAARPEEYAFLVEPVDLVYQDVAQRGQAEIASRNCARYLKSGGELILMLKTRSVDVTASPEAVLLAEKKNLQGLDLLQVMDLVPFHQDHFAMQAKKPSL
ncbi:MAG: fibrillarin-like rRNA/tRNA 2'-O-methyltransferase [Methanothrix sp.]|jgi:fibrillarin-like pre-rRNA processing protein|nr:fibrillarin-like rRNA/tRNA 2'-O-methyltransferase [Methanothrix sp.]